MKVNTTTFGGLKMEVKMKIKKIFYMICILVIFSLVLLPSTLAIREGISTYQSEEAFKSGEDVKVIDFDELSFDDEVSSYYWNSYGIMFSDNAQVTPILIAPDNRGNAETISEPHSLFNDGDWPETSEDKPLKIGFKQGQKKVGMYVGNAPEKATLIAYNKAGEEIVRFSRMDVGDSVKTFMGISSENEAIYTIKLDYGNALISEEIDNLMFSPFEEGSEEEIEEVDDNPVVTCKDTDGGPDFYTKGTCKGNNDHVLGGITSATDYCEGNILQEFVCGKTIEPDPYPIVVGRTSYKCPFGCRNGACIREAEEVTAVCSGYNSQEIGKSENYRVGDEVYTVTVNNIGRIGGELYVDFSVSAFESSLNQGSSALRVFSLREGETYNRFRNGDIALSVNNILYQEYAGGVHEVDFCFNGKKMNIVQSAIEVPRPVAEEDAKCGDSFGGDGYYAACKGDIIEHDTGLKLVVKGFTKDSLTLGIAGTDKELSFEHQREAISFNYNENRYNVEYNLYSISTVTIRLSHSENRNDESGNEVTIIEREPVSKTPKVSVEEPVCNGCKPNGVCLPFGTRLISDGIPAYCELDGNLQKQKELQDACQNNNECLSNQCSNGKCIDLSGQLAETRSLVESIVNWLKELLGAKV